MRSILPIGVELIFGVVASALAAPVDMTPRLDAGERAAIETIIATLPDRHWIRDAYAEATIEVGGLWAAPDRPRERRLLIVRERSPERCLGRGCPTAAFARDGREEWINLLESFSRGRITLSAWEYRGEQFAICLTGGDSNELWNWRPGTKPVRTYVYGGRCRLTGER